jgi:hypothetical protein
MLKRCHPCARRAFATGFITTAFTAEHTRKFQSHRILPNSLIAKKEVRMREPSRFLGCKEESLDAFLAYHARPHHDPLDVPGSCQGSGSKSLSDAKMEYPFFQRLSDKLTLRDPLLPRRFIGIVDAKTPINAERSEKSIVADPDAGRNCEAGEPKVPNLAPDVTDIDKLHEPEFVQESVVEPLQDVGPEFGATFKGEVAAELRIARCYQVT